ncbi:MAG: hypothetical protein J6S85_13715 [Methanobrevibacter sp.]|nr:hypothetical protein [Methanobrevibacter sp.]
MSEIFNQLAGNQNSNAKQVQNAQQNFDISKAFQQFQKNPVEYLLKAKFNIPDNVPANPSSIGQYLLQTGQINQNQIAQAMRMMNMGRR